MPRNVGSLSLKTTSALPALSTTTCFSSIIAASQPVPLSAGSPIPSRSYRFRLRFISRIASSRPSTPLTEPPSEPFRLRFCLSQAFPHRISSVSCVVPVGFPLAFSMFFDVYRTSSQSESEREGRSVLFYAECPMPSLRSPFRSPARWARRVAFRGVRRGGRREVLWDVSRETGHFPVHFSMPYKCHPCHLTGMSGIPVRWMNAVPCRYHAMRGVPYMSCCGVFRSTSVCRLAVKRYRSAYMVVLPLFSFLSGSGSGTALRSCIGLFGGILTLAGIGEECRAVWFLIWRLVASGGVLLDVIPYGWR